MTKKEIEIQEKAKMIVDRDIYHNLCLTIDKELEDNPDLLLEAENYYPQDENGKRDDNNGQYPEIFEFWAVSEWLGKKLKDEGEVVFDCLDFIVWGRQATGQAIYMDNVIEEITKDCL